MSKQSDLSGLWHFCYWYPSNNHEGDDPSEYEMRAIQKGKDVVLESLPNDIDAYMLVRLHLDDDVATGTWHETTSPHGEFKGMSYSGAGQLLLDAQKKRLEGNWAGIGLDRATGKAKMYTGRWEITRA